MSTPNFTEEVLDREKGGKCVDKAPFWSFRHSPRRNDAIGRLPQYRTSRPSRPRRRPSLQQRERERRQPGGWVDASRSSELDNRRSALTRQPSSVLRRQARREADAAVVVEQRALRLRRAATTTSGSGLAGEGMGMVAFNARTPACQTSTTFRRRKRAVRGRSPESRRSRRGWRRQRRHGARRRRMGPEPRAWRPVRRWAAAAAAVEAWQWERSPWQSFFFNKKKTDRAGLRWQSCKGKGRAGRLFRFCSLCVLILLRHWPARLQIEQLRFFVTSNASVGTVFTGNTL